MSTSQRVSLRFHRLAVFLAVIPLVLGVTLSAFFAYTAANREADQHQKLDCAHHVYQTNESAVWASALQPNNTDASVGLEEIGCSPNKWERASVEQVQSPPAFTWLSAFGMTPGCYAWAAGELSACKCCHTTVAYAPNCRRILPQSWRE
jgi:hypothetical protein